LRVFPETESDSWNPEVERLEPEIHSSFGESYFERVYGSDYDRRNPHYKHQSYLREVKRVAKEGGVLLDIGCAYGNFMREAVNCFEVHGCDISAHAVGIARSRVPSARIFQSDIFGIQRRGTYDAITCFDVLEHVPEVGEALLHLRGLLKPGGALVATMPVYDTIVGHLVGVLDRDPTHVHKLSRHAWVDQFRAAGFQQIGWKGILRYYFRGMFYFHCCARVVRRFSPAILITGVAK
jgi:2-polyprenyl-3-methyl-5-hydroxy-6-metoxy-1,4-benzoquinol methylase